MRTIDAFAASVGLLACLALGRMPGYRASPDELAAETWVMEQELMALLGAMSGPFEACYAMTLPSDEVAAGLPALAADRARITFAATCDPSTLLAFD
jgi:hypothetical protein